MTLDAIDFESLYSSAELNFHATGLKHKVNRGGHSSSPCGRSLLKHMDDNSSFPFPSLLLLLLLSGFQLLFISLSTEVKFSLNEVVLPSSWKASEH